MRIEVLYVSSCPHFPAAVARLREVLAAENVQADIVELEVTDARTAETLAFYGSPTIRINGRDVTGEASPPEGFAMACRLYDGTKQGIPPLEAIRHAVREAQEIS